MSLRLGIVGFGKIARDQHVRAIAATTGLELVAIASRHATLEGVANYRDIAAMLAEEPDLQAVVLCQPPQARFEAACAALRAGKHVFLEKPPGAAISDVEALVALAAENKVTLFASWHSRYASGVRAAKKWLDERIILTVQINWKEDIRHWHPGQEWILAPGGFGIFDPGINALSILTEIIVEPVRLLDADLDIPSNRQAPIAAKLQMETMSGAPIIAEFDFLQTGTQIWEIRIETDGGVLELQAGGNQLRINGRAQDFGIEAEYSGLYAHFIRLVSDKRSDVDISPLQLVADAFLRGRTCSTSPFSF